MECRTMPDKIVPRVRVYSYLGCILRPPCKKLGSDYIHLNLNCLKAAAPLAWAGIIFQCNQCLPFIQMS